MIPSILLLVLFTQGQPLRPGARIDRPLAVGDVHAWEVDAAAGDFVQVIVEQRGADAIATVIDPDGQTTGVFDTPNGDLGPEVVRFIAAAPGRHRVEIRSAAPEAEPGLYSIQLTALRPATQNDRRVAAAIAAQADATRLRLSPDTRRASLQRYQEAMALWREAGDRAGEVNALRAMGFAYVRLKEDDEAYKTFARTRTLWRELKDVRAEAFALLVLGTIHTRRGEPLETRARALEALPLWKPVDRRRSRSARSAIPMRAHAIVRRPIGGSIERWRWLGRRESRRFKPLSWAIVRGRTRCSATRRPLSPRIRDPPNCGRPRACRSTPPKPARRSRS